MSSVFDTYLRMKTPHLCERLRHLAQHRSPAVQAGHVTPVVPVPFADWLLLQEAAARIERLEYDITSLRRELERQEPRD